MEMPSEISTYIQQMAGPRTRPDWRKGSMMFRETMFSQLYWEINDGPWYEFAHPDINVCIQFYLQGWHDNRLNGVGLIQTLMETRLHLSVLTVLFEHMSSPRNIDMLLLDIRVDEPFFNDVTKRGMFCHIFDMRKPYDSMFEFLF
jgi:hypothetical protein